VILAEGAMEIRILKRRDLRVRETARRTGLSRNTVKRYLKSTEDPGYTARLAGVGKLDAHKAFLSERLAAAHPDRIPGTVLLSELRLRGYRPLSRDQAKLPFQVVSNVMSAGRSSWPRN
jgi:transposase